MKTALGHDLIYVGNRFILSFQRTLRVPDDGRPCPLPPSLGRLPIRAAASITKPPSHWSPSDFFVPLRQGEAVWLGLDAAPWKPHALQIGVGGIDAVSGAPWAEHLSGDPQDYVVCPPQMWLDGIIAGHEHIRQFVAMPLGQGFTVEGQLTGREDSGGIQIAVYDPLPGRFPDGPPGEPPGGRMATPRMGLGVGGKIRQRIYPDPHGLPTWDGSSRTAVGVHLVNSVEFERLTREPAPPSPIDGRTYTALGLPWFELYDEDLGDIAASPQLSGVKSISQLEPQGTAEPSEAVDVPEHQIKRRRH